MKSHVNSESRHSPQLNSFPVVCIGSSAGGVSALVKVVNGLSPEFKGSVLIVLHTSSYSILPSILSRSSYLKVEKARDGQSLESGQVLVAPPDFHMLIHDHRVVLSRGPRQNNVRPAIDPLFRSAARVFGPRAVGVVLSGTLDDGSAGLAAIKSAGGIAIVQNPDDAPYPEMPSNALAAVKADYILPAHKIGPTLNRLGTSRRGGVSMNKSRESKEHINSIEKGEAHPNIYPPGKISTLTCPECGGTLWELREGNVLRYVCHTGHEFSSESLGEAQHHSVENALWVALRTLKERATLLGKLADEAHRSGRHNTEHRYQSEEDELVKRAELLQKILLSEPTPHAYQQLKSHLQKPTPMRLLKFNETRASVLRGRRGNRPSRARRRRVV